MSEPAARAVDSWSRAGGALLDFGWSRETFAWACREAADRGLFIGAARADALARELARERELARRREWPPRDPFGDHE